MREYNIVIAGGGPAGAAAGLSLARRGRSVALFDARTNPNARPGETLPPEINPLLRELGLWDSFLALRPLESPGVISAWGTQIPQETDFTANAFGCGWHIDRQAFDAMLLNAAEQCGVRVFRGMRADLSRGEFAIDATGQTGITLDGSRERVSDDLLLALVLRLDCGTRAVQDLRTLIEAAADGWWYSSPLPGNALIAMFFTTPDIYRKGDDFIGQQLASAPLTRASCAGAYVIRTDVTPVSSSCRRQVSGTRWLAAGDSACSFDPLSGRGIFKALRHGVEAAATVDRALDGDMQAVGIYEDKVRRDFEAYRRQRESFYRMERRWRDQPFWLGRRGVQVSAMAR